MVCKLIDVNIANIRYAFENALFSLVWLEIYKSLPYLIACKKIFYALHFKSFSSNDILRIPKYNYYFSICSNYPWFQLKKFL